MEILPCSTLRIWISARPERWSRLRLAVAVKAGGDRKTIWAQTKEKVFFQGAAIDFVSVDSFWRIFTEIAIDRSLAEMIRAEIELDRVAAEERADRRRQEERLDAETRQQKLKDEVENARLAELLRRQAAEEWLTKERERKAQLREAKKQRYFAQAERIKIVLVQHGVQSLFHFTRVENLTGILTKGLLPRCEIDTATTNDTTRADGFLEASSLSISFPNYKLFYRDRMTSPGSRWVVLEIDPNALCHHVCAFNTTNAADRRMFEKSLDERATPEALSAMFAPQAEGPDKKSIVDREQLHIPNSYPTDPQAEVLLFGRLDPSYIRRLIFEDSATREAFLTGYGPGGATPKIDLDKSFFSYRSDYAHWKKSELKIVCDQEKE